MMNNILLVGGNFAENIRPSGLITKIYSHMMELNIPDATIELHNGGTFEELDLLLTRLSEFNIVLWFANVPNTYDKIVNNIKENNQKIILVTSKNNLEDKYSYHEITARMLKVKANLCLIFTKLDGLFAGTIIDPLLNGYCEKELNWSIVSKVLLERAIKLTTYGRSASIKGGDSIEVPDVQEFFNIAHNRAEQFHELIHAFDTSRFLGNLSFRCERGFPSYRVEDNIFVSRRNIDKRDITKEGFVGVSLKTLDNGSIKYFGDNKPSVDTPIQVALYNEYPNIKYMMHSHVYVEGAIITSETIPCGAMEEIAEVIKHIPNKDITEASINLKGHGSIVMCSDLKYFDTIKYIPRPVLEF